MPKFRITLKDPDGFYEGVREAAHDQISVEAPGITGAEQEALVDMRADTLRGILRQWVSYNEYVTIEFDTDEPSAAVIRRGH